MTTFADLKHDIRTHIGRADSVDDTLNSAIRQAISFLEKNFEFPYLTRFRQYTLNRDKPLRALNSIEARNLKNFVQAWRSPSNDTLRYYNVYDCCTDQDDRRIFAPMIRLNAPDEMSYDGDCDPRKYWLDTSNTKDVRFIFRYPLQKGEIFRVMMNEYTIPWLPSNPPENQVNTIDQGVHPLLDISYSLVLYRACIIIAATLRDDDLMKHFTGLYQTELEATNRTLQDNKTRGVIIGESTYNRDGDVRFGVDNSPINAGLWDTYHISEDGVIHA